MGTHSQVGCHRINHSSEFFAEHGYLEVPGLVQWMATLRCRLSCEHCLAVSQEAGFADMPLEKVTGLIDEVAAMGVREFLVTGGEPLVREDLAEVIEYLGGRAVSWSLNTAAMPDAGLREAIARNKPGFVAVSLDGPQNVHDGFRGKAGAYEEATEAIRFFKSLGVKVCAGTTVTSRNYDYLDETFHLVVAGGADQWGIHLLVPEGRAARRKDLFLSRAQLKRLIKFVARRRQYFDVEMADEIGYLGYLEPLVRDLPLSCGAGRAQCVVLPDGSVVPCTTLDRSCSAGNIHERSLAQIWAEGFQDLRSWRPEGKCGRCDYSPACHGGCWLQRKSGTQCFKEVWHVPEALKTAAGIAICLGTLAPQGESHAAGPAVGALSVAHAISAVQAAAVTSPNLMDDVILTLYINQAAGQATYLPAGVDLNDPGWKFVKDFIGGTLPADMTERCTVVSNALQTQVRSLSLIALLWRAVSGPLYDAARTQEYSEAERQIIRDTLAAMKQKAESWRLEIFANNLDPYLSNGRHTPRPVMTKSASLPVFMDRYFPLKDLNEERWGVAADPETREAAEAYMQAHHYAEYMELTCTISPTSKRAIADANEGEAANPPIVLGSSGAMTIGVFDVIAPGSNVTLSFGLTGTLRVPSSAYETSQDSLLNDQGGEQDLSTVVTVTLAAGREYTYVELLNAIYQGMVARSTLLLATYEWLSPKTVSLWDRDRSIVAAVYQNGALLWPAIREILESDATLPPRGRSIGDTRDISATPFLMSDMNVTEVQRRAVLKDIDFWMF
jgi:radical SAM protein with 4Fe4S-binding SPASM domain